MRPADIVTELHRGYGLSAEAERVLDVVRRGLRCELFPPHLIDWAPEYGWIIRTAVADDVFDAGDAVGMGHDLWAAICDARSEWGIRRYRAPRAPSTPTEWLLDGQGRRVELHAGPGGPLKVRVVLYERGRVVGEGWGLDERDAFAHSARKGAAA